MDAASAYLGVTRTEFTKQVDARSLPPGVPSLGRLLWDRFALDVISTATSGQAAFPDLGQIALSRAAPGSGEGLFAPRLDLASTDALLPKTLIEAAAAADGDPRHRTVQRYSASAHVRGPSEPPLVIRIEGTLTKARQVAARRFGSGPAAQEILLQDATGTPVAIRPAGRRQWDILQ